nr:MMPL family transporter [Chromatiaceae bacterium]
MNRRLVLLALWLLCLCALAWWTLARLRVTNDLSLFLPEAVSMDGRLLLTQVREGVAASTLLAAIAGERPSQDIARASRALAEGLRQDRQFARVANGELGSIDQSELDTLFTHRFLVGPPGPCLDALTVTGLQQALVARLAELRGPVPVLDGERTGSDPVGCFPSLLAGLSPHDGPARTHGVWFSRDGRRALAIFQTRGDASDIAGQRAAINRLQSLFASLPEAQGLHLELSGPGYFAVASEQAISSETQYLSIVATVLVLAILWFAFDSAALVMLGMLPVLSGILVGVALVSALFGPVHGIALALAFTLMGVTLD